MDRADALATLGLDDGASPEEARARYLALLREHHPDVSAAGTRSTRAAAAITEAWRVLRAAFADAAAGETGEPDGTEAVAVNDTLVIALPPDEAFAVLLDAASDVGSVSYVDRQSGLLEAIVTSDGPAHSLVITVQGRAATGATEAFCTLTPLGVDPPEEVRVEPVVDRLAEIIRRRLMSR